MKKIYIGWLSCLFAWSLSAQIENTLVWQNVPRTYLLYLPADYDPTQRYPVVVACHPGLSNSAQHAEAARWQVLGNTAGFISVYPNGMPSMPNSNTRLWNAYDQPSTVSDYDDAGFLNALLDRLIQQYAVDTCRMYMSGFSNGAMMTYRMACDFTHRFAAVAPLSGGWGYGADGVCGDGNCDGDVAPGCTWKMAYVNCQPAKPLPVIFMKGSLEGNNLPTCRGTTDSLNRIFWSDFLNCGNSVTDTFQAAGETILRERFNDCAAHFEFYTVLGNGHQWHAPATPLFWNFFEHHNKCNDATATQEPERRNNLNVYPTTVDDEVLIQYDGQEDFTVTLLDLTGRTVFQGQNTTRIAVSAWQSGLYLLLFKTNRYREIRRIMVR